MLPKSTKENNDLKTRHRHFPNPYMVVEPVRLLWRMSCFVLLFFLFRCGESEISRSWTSAGRRSHLTSNSALVSTVDRTGLMILLLMVLTHANFQHDVGHLLVIVGQGEIFRHWKRVEAFRCSSRGPNCALSKCDYQCSLTDEVTFCVSTTPQMTCFRGASVQ